VLWQFWSFGLEEIGSMTVCVHVCCCVEVGMSKSDCGIL
jgi:hypothetical protein